jgi:hypothetical protein
VVFSFIDIKAYRKVQSNLIKETVFFSKNDVENAEPNNEQITKIVEGLVKIRECWKSEGWNISLATCAEQINLEQYGTEHNRCIDDELMKRIFSEDTGLIYYLSYGKLPDKNSLFANEIPNKSIDLKDKGQRKVCGCMISKDIGMYNTCNHLCVYCYANTSKEAAEKNLSLYNTENESIINK